MQAPVPLACRIFDDFVGLESLRETWDATVLDAAGSVYMTFDWLRVWWDFYGGDAELRLFTFWRDQQLVAVVPVYIDTIGWGPSRLRVARLVGSNIPPKVFDPPMPQRYSTTVLAQVMTRLFADESCDLLSFGPVSERDGWSKRFADVRTQHPDIVGRCAVTRTVHSVFELPDTMDEYYARLSKNERKHRRKYDLRLLAKEFDTRVEIVREPGRVSEEFERFAEQHRKQWLAERRSGHFGAWPKAMEFNRALVMAQAERGRLRFIRIVANGEVIANQYTFAFGDRYYWELPARAIDPKWDRFSLGPSSIVTMLSEGIREGITRVEGGLAHYDYKIRLGAREYPALTFGVASPGLASRLRGGVMSLVRNVARVGYHKLWYRRVMPRLPERLWTSQPRWWLRLDF